MKMANPEPLVCAIMLTRDRPAMARRALEAFKAQTYGRKEMLILDTGAAPADLGVLGTIDQFSSREYESCEFAFTDTPERAFVHMFDEGITQFHGYGMGRSIGSKRNLANELASLHGNTTELAPIIVHWDDDDWSDPNRIAEQVALLKSSGADVAGYRELLFWDNRKCADVFDGGVAWLYSHPHPSYCLGTSLCYWRRTWELRPFRDISNGEEHWFCEGRKCVGESSLKAGEPRMIASIHGANTGPNYNIEALIARGSREWKRAPQWDEYCRERMNL